MTFTVLSLELNREVPDPRRNKMYEELRRLQWRKLSEAATMWQKVWLDGHATAAYVDAAKQEISTTAKSVGIFDYDAAVVVSNCEPAPWNMRISHLTGFERFLALPNL